MKLVLFAAGNSKRFGENKLIYPINGEPLIKHVIRSYERHGVEEVLVLLGNRYNEFQHIEFNNRVETVFSGTVENEHITAVQLRVVRNIIEKEYCDSDGDFLLGYADTYAYVDIYSLINQHKRFGGKPIVTLTVANPRVDYGRVFFDSARLVTEFSEKQVDLQQWKNIGYFVVNKRIYDFIERTDFSLEKHIFPKLIKLREMRSFIHSGLHFSVDTKKDAEELAKCLNGS